GARGGVPGWAHASGPGGGRRGMTSELLVVLGLFLVLPSSASVRVRRERRFRGPAAAVTRWRGSRAPQSMLIDLLGGFRDELRSGRGLRGAFESAADGCSHPAI